MWPWANERHRHLVCFANPESPRVSGLTAAVRQSPQATVEIVPWLDVLQNRWRGPLTNSPETVFRLESPGKNWLVEQAILALGADVEDPNDPGGTRWDRMPRRAVASLPEDKGRLLPMRQWQLGWTSLLHRVATAAGPDAHWFSPPEDVLCMFDKAASQNLLERTGCPVPPSLGIPDGFDDLLDRMEKARHARVFLKSCHGSSASGVVALEYGSGEMQAFSTVAVSGSAASPLLHNSRKVLRYQHPDEIRILVNHVCRLRAMTQAWIPKAGWRGCRMDLRVVVIGGQATHIVPRLSRSPFTTLQLGARRGDAGELRREAGEEKWALLLSAAESAAAACPKALYSGVDVLVTPGWRRAFVLELNAFGDLLPGVRFHGRDTYTAQLAAAGML